MVYQGPFDGVEVILHPEVKFHVIGSAPKHILNYDNTEATHSNVAAI